MDLFKVTLTGRTRSALRTVTTPSGKSLTGRRARYQEIAERSHVIYPQQALPARGQYFNEMGCIGGLEDGN